MREKKMDICASEGVTEMLATLNSSFRGSDVYILYIRYLIFILSSPVETDATLWAHNSQHCWANNVGELLRPFTRSFTDL